MTDDPSQAMLDYSSDYFRIMAGSKAKRTISIKDRHYTRFFFKESL